MKNYSLILNFIDLPKDTLATLQRNNDFNAALAAIFTKHGVPIKKSGIPINLVEYTGEFTPGTGVTNVATWVARETVGAGG